MTYERDARKEYARRRRDMLEKVLDILNEFDRTYRNQKALYDTYCDLTSPSEEQEQIRKEFEGLDEELRVAFGKFADASGILHLLGETNAEISLDTYHEAVNEWYETPLPKAEQTDGTALAVLREKVISRRSTLMEKLSDADRAL